MRKGMILASLFLVTFWSLSLSVAAEPIRMRFGHVAPPMHAQHKGALWFADYVEKHSGGRIKCSVHPSGQLGAHNQMLEACQVGTLEMASVAGSALADFVPQVALISFPFFYATQEEYFSVIQSPIGEKIAAAFPAKGLVCGGWATHGWKAFLNRKLPITKIEDLRLSKMRVIPNQLFLDTYQAMGVSPVTLPWPEVFSALQRGVIDGIDLTLNETWGARIFEVVKYISLCNLGQNPQIYVASKKFIDGLPEDLRTIVLKGMKEAAQWHTEKVLGEDKTVVVPDLLKAGIKINTIAESELQRFKDAVKPVHEKWKKIVGPDLYEETVAFLRSPKK
jgi:tripartite ATP-independent transporter DctP family solute receptor